MIFYLVRHGETPHNVKKLYPDPAVTLSEEGHKQSEAAAEALAEIPLDLIISSTYPRAKQTAEIINKKLKKPIEFSELFIENIRPSKVVGKERKAPEIVTIYEEIKKNEHDPNWHHSDEENFHDFRDRALKALELLKAKKVDHAAVITHSSVVRMLICAMIFGDKLDPRSYKKIYKALHSHNTSISTVEYTDTDGWKIVTWNDHKHLK